MHAYASMLQAIILTGFLGLVIGNFATNPIYRLPRRESLFGRDPYCGDCNSLLKPRDLFPVFSWLSTQGKCRYCGAPVPGAYTVTEALIGLIFIVAYFEYGISESYILITFGLTAFIMLGMMLTIDNFFSDRTLVAALAFGLLYRTLSEATIFGAAGTLYAAALAAALFWKASGTPLTREVGEFPPYVKLLIAAGAWLSIGELFGLLLGVALSRLFKERGGWITEWVIAGSTVAIVLSRTLR